MILLATDKIREMNISIFRNVMTKQMQRVHVLIVIMNTRKVRQIASYNRTWLSLQYSN